MKELSIKAEKIQASTTMAIDNKYKELKSKGIDVVGFAAGEPDFSTPQSIKDAGIEAIMNGNTLYTAASGMKPLKEAICNRLKLNFDLDYDVENISVGNGAKTCVFAALNVLLNPGDEVIIPAPYWVSYSEMVNLCGGVPVIVLADELHKFKVTAKQIETAINEKTKCILLNNPCNPTGSVYSKIELLEIAEVCKENDIYIISDEVYYNLIYDDSKFVSVASLSDEIKERTILINGVSKAYAMTGWRIGYVATNKNINKLISNYLSHATGNPCTISQYAAMEALNGSQENVEIMRKAFEERRNYICDRINSMDRISCIKPDGAFYIMVNIKDLFGSTISGELITNSNDFAMSLLNKGLVAVVPSTGFGIEGYVRWSYASSIENIKIGLDRLEKFLNS